MDAFTRTLGASQGRVERADGSVVFVLGELEPGRLHNLRPGDCVEIAQTVDVTNVALVRVRGSLAVPRTSAPWRVSLRVDGAEAAGLTCTPGRARPISDLAANVAPRQGAVEIAVRLTLVEAS